MKDLDFDELDRAVSSLMTNASKSEPVQAEDKVLTITSTLDGVSPASPAFSATQSPSTDETPVVSPVSISPSPAARRSGRFMDVVHPSSDMKSAPSLHRVSREGVTISAPAVDTSVNSPVESSASMMPHDVEPDTSPQGGESGASTASWPDPIDFHASKQADTTPESVSEPTKEPDILEQAVVDDVVETTEPLQSPFLSGAKVEKRPLGAFATPEVTPSETTIPDNDTTSPEDAAKEEASVEASSQPSIGLPEELKSDIVAIEADSQATTSPDPVEATPVVATASTPVAPVPLTNPGPASIKQQYTEEPSSTPAEHAPIYDSASYTQPLAHPAKKKSGWLVVFFIVLLILIGAGAGAAIYYRVLSV